MIILNGKAIKEKTPGTLYELIKLNNFNYQNIVILVNGEIIKKEQWQNYKLKDNDSVEIIGFVGGG